jgi:hypothetical protein
MLCSRCSGQVKPVVAIDIDGTLGDYHSHFLWFAVEYFDMDDGEHDDYDGTKGFKEWWCRTYDRSERDWHEVKLAYRQGGMKRTMPILDGAQDLCWLVHDLGAELWITTTRPYLSLDNIVPDTVEWCRRHDIRYDGMLFDEDKYTKLAEQVDSERVIAVFDDLPEMCDAASKILYWGSDVVTLVKNHWNSGVEWTYETTLPKAAAIVMNRVETWSEENVA